MYIIKILACFVQKLLKKNIWGSARPPPPPPPLGKGRVKNGKKLSYTCKYRGLSSGEFPQIKRLVIRYMNILIREENNHASPNIIWRKSEVGRNIPPANRLKTRLKSDFHSRTSLVARNIFVSENQKSKSYQKVLHLITAIIVTDDDFPKQVSVQGF